MPRLPKPTFPLLCAALLLTTACTGLRPAPAPLPTRQLATAPAGSDCLVVLLPGIGDAPRDFLDAGFPATAAAAGLRADLVAADLHMGYYRQRTTVERLHRDLVAPAREEGEQVWLVGISLGGLGALLYAESHPEQVAGVVLLSPFLGRGPALDEIAAAGDLQAWDYEAPEEPRERAEGDEVWYRLWAALRRLTAQDSGAPPIWLGSGTGDRLAASHALLARELPAERVVTVDGGHDWDTWKTLWRRLTAAGVPACERVIK